MKSGPATLIGLAGLLVCAGLLAVLTQGPSSERAAADRLLSRLEAGSFPKGLDEISPPVRADESNAALAISNLVSGCDDSWGLSQAVGSKDGQEVLRQASRASRYRPEPFTQPVPQTRKEADAIWAGVREFAERGAKLGKLRRFGESVQAFDTARRLALLLDDFPTARATQNCSIAVKAICSQVVISAEHDPTEGEYLEGLRALLAASFPDPNLKMTLATEFWLSADVVARTRPALYEKISAAEDPWVSTLEEPLQSNPKGLPKGNAAARVLAPLLQKMDDRVSVLEDASLPPGEKKERLQELERKWGRKLSESPVIEALVRLEADSLPYAQTVSAAGARSAAQAYVMVLLYKLKEGRLPDRAQLLEYWPVDPALGRPVGYQRQGAGFRVWSTGYDLLDNKGRRPVKEAGDDWSETVLYFPGFIPSDPKPRAVTKFKLPAPTPTRAGGMGAFRPGGPMGSFGPGGLPGDKPERIVFSE